VCIAVQQVGEMLGKAVMQSLKKTPFLISFLKFGSFPSAIAFFTYWGIAPSIPITNNSGFFIFSSFQYDISILF
jgi:hypothetical protein